jgi:short-subunit dehydrogenase
MATKKRLNILIFGASSSIGSYLAKKYYDEGHNIYLFYRNKKKNLSIKKNNSGQILEEFKNFDINPNKNFNKKIYKIKNILNKANIIINTIGKQGEINNFFKSSINKFLNTFNINFFSYIFFFKSIHPYIRLKKDLLLIVFSGGGTTSFRKNFSSYSISKISLVKLVEIIANEINNKNIRINAISPGIIKSQMTDEIIKNKHLVDNQELKKIKREINNSKKSLERIYDLISFLMSKNGRRINGKMISSRWDDFKNWNFVDIKKIQTNEFFTLRRKTKI